MLFAVLAGAETFLPLALDLAKGLLTFFAFFVELVGSLIILFSIFGGIGSCFGSFNGVAFSNSKNMEKGGKSPEASLIANFNSIFFSSSSSVKNILPPSIVLCKIIIASFNVFDVLNALHTCFICDNDTKPEYLSPFFLIWLSIYYYLLLTFLDFALFLQNLTYIRKLHFLSF